MRDELSNDVFVSYRRETSQYLALALWQNLTEHGVNVFFDLETIRAGRFESVILNQVAARPYMIPVLQPGALNRCANAGDWFLREIHAGLAEDRVLVPVRTPEFDLADIDRFLPPSVAEGLRSFNMVEIPPRYFRAAIDDLARNFLKPIALQVVPPTSEARDAATEQATLARRADRVSETSLTAEELATRGFASWFLGGPDALELVEQAIAKDPKCAAAYRFRAQIMRGNGDYQSELQDYLRVIRLDPSDVAARLGRANALRDLGDVKGALSSLDEAIHRNPNAVILFWARMVLRTHLGQSRKIEREVREITQRYPDDPDAYYYRALAQFEGYYLTGGATYPQGAVKDLNKAIQLEPSNADYFILRGRARAASTGDIQGAIEDFSEAHRLGDGRALVYRGEARRKLSDPLGAVEDFTTVLRHNPADDDLLWLRGESHVDAQDYEQAIEDFTEAIRLRPNPEWFKRRGEIREKVDDYEGAIADYDETLRLDPRHPGVKWSRRRCVRKSRR